VRKIANPTSYRNFAPQHSKKIVALRICNTFIMGNIPQPDFPSRYILLQCFSHMKDLTQDRALSGSLTPISIPLIRYLLENGGDYHGKQNEGE
jgi:hypothetical protein